MALVELTDLRSQKAKHYRDDVTGRNRAVFTIHDQHYRASGYWTNVSETLANSKSAGYAKVASEMRHIIELKDDAARLWLPRRDYDKESVLVSAPKAYDGDKFNDLSLSTATAKTAALEWSRSLYVIKNSITWRKNKQTIVIEKGGPLRWQTTTTLNNLTWSGWKIYSGKTLVGWLEQPWAVDAKGQPVKVTYTLTNGVLDVVIDDTDATYPITLDPTFVDGPSGDVTTSCDNYVRSAEPAVNRGDNNVVVAFNNYYSQYQYGLFRFNLSSIAAGSSCTSATCSLYYNEQWENNSGLALHQIAAANLDWTEMGSTYNTKDGTNAWAGGSSGCGTSGTDYDATADGTYSFATRPADGDEMAVDLTTSRVANKFGGNYDLVMLCNASGKPVGCYASDYSTAGYRPLLTVDYTAGGAAPTVRRPRKGTWAMMGMGH